MARNTARPLTWSAVRLRADAPSGPASASLALIWATDALAVVDDAGERQLGCGDLMLVDRRQPFTCVGAGTDWSARLLDFAGRDDERMLDRFRPVLWQVLDGRSAAASAIRNIWLSLEDLHEAGLTEGEYQAVELLVGTLVVLASNDRDAERGSGYTQAVLARAKAIVLAQLSNPDLGVTMIAERLGLSTRRVAAIFAVETITPTAFITAQRMKSAHAVLTDPGYGDRQIQTIGWSCGYRSHNHFCRTFKAHFGMSPSECRRAAARR